MNQAQNMPSVSAMDLADIGKGYFFQSIANETE